MLDLNKFAERLDELIFDTQLTQSAFAQNVGISPSKVSEYLKAQRTPSIKTLVKIADFFQCTTDYVLGFEEQRYTVVSQNLPPFNQKLRKLLAHFHYTGYKFCKEATNINSTRYYQWLNGKYQPSLESIVNIAEFFDCTVDFVLGRSE